MSNQEPDLNEHILSVYEELAAVKQLLNAVAKERKDLVILMNSLYKRLNELDETKHVEEQYVDIRVLLNEVSGEFIRMVMGFTGYVDE